MKVLVVGGGGREHAIVKKLKQSKEISALYCAPGNGLIASDATCVPLKATDLDAITAWCADNQIDYVVVAPDDPLCLGLVDLLAEKGIPAFGPTKQAAMIEGSKVFSKNLMKKYHIPTADYQTFNDCEEALDYVKTQPMPVVVKADGLALGKGAIICEDIQQASTAIREMMLEGKFGASGASVVIEEFMQGPEVSVLCFTDGNTIVPMISSMDHKRALTGDEGLNTGGMGVIAPNPYYTDEVAKTCMDTIFLPTLDAMRKEGRPFKGCLFVGLMLTKNGPRVIEYNCRFGDPEAQAVLSLLESDLLPILMACTNGTLDKADVRFADKASCCVVLASGGYPQKYETGFEITGIEDAQKLATVYGAGVKAQDGKLVTAGGRVLGVTATGDMLPDAIGRCYRAAYQIHFDNAYLREDIGASALKALGKDD